MNSKLTDSQLLMFIKENDNNFTPPLRDSLDLNAYSQKLWENAELITEFSGNTPIAVSATYMNDSNSNVAYLSYINVSSDFQNKGIGKILIGKTISRSKEKGFKELRLEVKRNNEVALHFYLNIGFVKIKNNDSSFIMSLPLF